MGSTHPMHREKRNSLMKAQPVRRIPSPCARWAYSRPGLTPHGATVSKRRRVGGAGIAGGAVSSSQAPFPYN